MNKDDLFNFAENPDKDIETMSSEDIDKYLKEEGIDTTQSFKALKRKMKGTKESQDDK